ncbi:putative K domain, type 1 superfamily protein [Helianthus anomalus]
MIYVVSLLLLLQIDGSTKRTVQIDGSSDQIEAAKQLVNEVINGEACVYMLGDQARAWFQKPHAAFHLLFSRALGFIHL